MYLRTVFTTAAVAVLMILTVAGQTDAPIDHVIIHATKPYQNVVAQVEAAGGRVKHQYRYFDAIAAEIPRGALEKLRQLAGVMEVSKDAIVPAPRAVDTLRAERDLTRTGDDERIGSDSVAGIAAADLPAWAAANPDAYLINNSNLNVSPLHATGTAGQGVIVALIDSGIRPGFPHISLDGSVIGGEDFVGDGLGFSNFGNSGHGTFVAGMVSANALFTFSPGALLLQSVRIHCPSCVTGLANTQIPMMGTAPLSSIYALRVFGPTGGAPTSRVLSAVERVIDLREKFDAGDPDGRNIQICNMSLGGPTLFAGRDLFDTAVNVLLDRGIVLTASAGNAGPSSLTGGSPGTAFEALTVGAASYAHNERILRDTQFGLGIGALYRPFGGTQAAYFSSRGPTADGRIDPDVTANAFASFGQGFADAVSVISLASGTSFGAPTVAGVAALLRQAFPSATARQIRNAILLSANPDILTDGSSELDQGEGLVDAQAAYDLLAAGGVPDTTAKTRRPKRKVKQNVRRGTALDPLKGTVEEEVSGLKPGQRADFLYQVTEKTAQVVINLSNVSPAPAPDQNQLFGDDILLAIHTAKTSEIGDGDDYEFLDFTSGGTFVINDPEPGLMRVTVNGDWTNASPISANVLITSTKEPLRRHTARGKIEQDQVAAVPVQIPPDVKQAVFFLRWKKNWSHYPTSDLDLILVDPSLAPNYDGVSLDSPEQVVVDNPAPGTWVALVDGFNVHARDAFDLRVTLDGIVVE